MVTFKKDIVRTYKRGHRLRRVYCKHAVFRQNQRLILLATPVSLQLQPKPNMRALTNTTARSFPLSGLELKFFCLTGFRSFNGFCLTLFNAAGLWEPGDVMGIFPRLECFIKDIMLLFWSW